MDLEYMACFDRLIRTAAVMASTFRDRIRSASSNRAPMNEQWRSAIHEAGHAVIGRALGMICGDASIRPNEDEGEAGFSFFAEPHAIAWRWEQQERYREFSLVLRGRILAYMAGAESERVLLGACQGGDDDDQFQILLMADSADCNFDPDSWSRREPRMRAMTRMLVRRHQASIEKVAAALLERETLAADEIDTIIASHAHIA